jgi:molybdopterin synthase catalytic subunit
MLDANDTLIVSQNPLSADQCIGLVTDDAAGGIAVFIGTTRAEQTPDPKRHLVALDYQVYDEMANRQIHDIAQRARAQWPIIRLVIAHRVGRVPLARPSVIIAVSTPHRADAFAACRWIIDTLKASAAIWKKEVWSDGTTTWVEPSAPVRESRG